MAYRIKPEIAARFPTLSTAIQHGGGWKTVSLTGKPFTALIDGDKDKPPESREIPAATQAELKQMHEQGHPFTETFNDKE